MKTVLRDAVLIYCLGFLGIGVGAIVILSAAHGHVTSSTAWAITAMKSILNVVGFTVCGAFAKGDRFPHLLRVALTLWAFGCISFLLSHYSGATFSWRIVDLLWTLLEMAVGGALSFLFVRRQEAPYSGGPV